MYKRYQIKTATAELESMRIGKFTIIRSDECANCGQCAEWCIYGVHRRDSRDPRLMAEPLNHLCKNCFSCIQNCPRQALKMVKNEEYENLGDSYWTPHKIWTIWNEAEEGMIPVYGAGYRGRFRGLGFDDIWTDMSEIVRPTRDGIHGREYIATAVDIGRKLPFISNFEHPSSLPVAEIKIPMLLETRPLGLRSESILMPVIKTAQITGTLALLDIEDWRDELIPYLPFLALRLRLEKTSELEKVPWRKVGFVEIIVAKKTETSWLEEVLRTLRVGNPGAVISLTTSTPALPGEFLEHFKAGKADVLTCTADSHGRNAETGHFISESIRSLHLAFVKERIRDEITLIGGGGIAAAEHVPKLIICGADAVVLDIALLVALGCRVCRECDFDTCPAGIKTLDQNLAAQRMVNMISSWRDQLLEILSAMGIKDVRRLRGEVGRAMFYEEIERKSFEFIFNNGEKRR
ncbi:MAG: glutamate synthase-related protein [Candidatus Aminicenantales bacterium]